jgi:phosphocarrier protein HPr
VTSPETRHEKSRMTEENSVLGSAVITHEIGLHARPSVKLTKLAKTFESQIHLRGESAGEGGASWVDAKSIVRVMGLKLREGTTVHFRAAGPDAEAAIDALIGLVKRDFDERPAA